LQLLNFKYVFFFAKRLLKALMRNQIGSGTWNDDYDNFANFFFSNPHSIAKCPLCGYNGPFLQHAGRPRQICPFCKSRARHRVLYLSINRFQQNKTLRWQNILHMAPEKQLGNFLKKKSQLYISGDINYDNCQVGLDLCNIPFKKETFDFVCASHVLEHIVDDSTAIEEIYRVLHHKGIAVLIVPITVSKTIDFGYVDPTRNFHTRECGLDYFERYKKVGFEIELLKTEDFEDADLYALSTWENNKKTSHWIPFCIKI